MQNAEPLSLYCGDETDGESLRACEQINESLYRYEVGGTAAIPALATECTANADSTTWTCKLRDGVKFHDGADLDANDVVAELRPPVGHQAPAAQGPHRRVRRTGPACGAASSTRPRAAVEPSASRTNRVGGAAPAAPPTSSADHATGVDDDQP